MSQPALMNVSDLAESDWEVLMSRIKNSKCTPILGAGTSFPTIPLASELAKWMAEANKYPFLPPEVNDEDGNEKKQPKPLDLAEVAQYIAVKYNDGIFPKEQIQKRFAETPPPDFTQPNEPHGILAALNQSVYITTNYDNFMFEALRRQGKQPQRAVCLWNKQIEGKWSIFKQNPEYTPTPDTPVVFHLHGHIEAPESMVLTEDDYLDFLVAVSQDRGLLPEPIVGALAKHSLLVIGYGLKDWNFRVLLRGIMATVQQSQQRLNVTVQFPPDEPAKERMEYLTKYYDRFYKLTVCWDTASEFARRLGSKIR
jgi:SIR2-like domain